MASKNKVKVFVRFRPTPNFAQDQIEFHQDGKVRFYLVNLIGIYENVHSEWKL